MGSSQDEGTTVYLLSADGDPATLYHHREDAWVSGLSRDETLLCLSHSEHGDNRHPALRLMDLNGRTVSDLWDGPARDCGPGSGRRCAEISGFSFTTSARI